jgi:hypothetical protein
MRKSQFNDPPKRIDLSPPCGMCGTPMFLSCIEPADADGHDQRTFECMACRHSQTVVVKYKKTGEEP